MKPDNSIDYYAVLGVQPSASEEDIKKAFRKQALLHHPDRNPGKEEEAKVRFQDAQVAHDILSDKARREKYDRDRLKQKNGLWEKKPASTKASPSPTPAGPGASAFQQTQNARPARSTTASRYAAFAKSPRESYYGQDKDTKFNAFKAWEQMKTGHRMQQEQQQQQPQQQAPPRPARPAPTAQKQSRTRSDWDETPTARGSPGVARSQSTRTPRRGGFNPYSNTGDEPISRNRSSYYNTTRAERSQTTESRYYPPPASPGRGPRTESVGGGEGPARPNLADMRTESLSSERLSTPYANTPRERTYFAAKPSNIDDDFRRSSKSSSNLESLGSRDSGRTMRPNRHRSASPNARTPQPPGADDTSPSESEDEVYTDSMKRSQQAGHGRRASADPRFNGPRVTVENDPGDLPARFQNTQRNQTWASSPLDEQQFARFHGPPHRDSQPIPLSSSSHSHPSQRGPPPYGIYAPRPMHGNGGGNGPVGNGPVGNGAMPPSHGDPTATGAKRPSIFSMPSSSSSSAVPSKTSSVENVNVQFSPTDWHGKFTSAADYLGPQPGHGGTGSRASPPKRSPPRDSNSHREGANPSQQMPPPPPPQGSAATDFQSQPSSPPKFSSEQWNKSFKEGSWVLPGPPLPPRPVQTPRSRNARTTPVRRTPVNGRSAGPPVGEDTGNEGDDEARQSASNNETDGDDMSRSASATAMDIDTDTPPAAAAAAAAASASASASRNTSAPPAPGQSSDTTGPALNPTDPITTPSPSLGTAFPKPTEPQTGFSMHQMRNVFPMGSISSASGLAGMKADLGTTLPFESGTSTKAPGPAPKPQRLELPQPPKPPLKPSYYTQVACEFYMKKFSAYMREFQAFNARMLDHFNARQAGMVAMTQNSTAAAEKGFLPMCNGMGGGGNNNGMGQTNGGEGGAAGGGGPGTAMMADMAAWSWMGARGDDGYLRYTAWLREDDQVQEHWNEAWDVHRKAVKELGEVRKVMKALANSK